MQTQVINVHFDVRRRFLYLSDARKDLPDRVDWNQSGGPHKHRIANYAQLNDFVDFLNYLRQVLQNHNIIIRVNLANHHNADDDRC